MAIDKTYKTLTILAAGVTTSFPLTDSVDVYDIKASGGSVVLAGNVTITASGTPSVGSTYSILLGGGFTLGAFGFSIFGTLLTAAQCLYKQVIFCYYNGTTWDVYINSDDTDNSDDVNGGDIVDGTVTNAKLTGNIALTKLANLAARGYLTRGGVNGVVEGFNAVTAGTFIGGNGTDVVMQTMSGDATINGSGAITLADGRVITTKLADANVTVAKVSADLKSDTIIIPVSFQSGEVGNAFRYKMPYPGSIVDVYAIATTAIAAVDSAFITLQNNAGVTMTVTTPITFAASDAYGTAYTSAVTANNTFVAGDILRITTAKVTAGGRALVSLKVIRS